MRVRAYGRAFKYWTGHSPKTLPLSHNSPATVWIEGFGCEIAPEFIASYAISISARASEVIKTPVWINLEYLSAESYVERCHALPSPVMQGPAKGWTKHFYYPGFTAGTGGLLRESNCWQPQRNGTTQSAPTGCAAME